MKNFTFLFSAVLMVSWFFVTGQNLSQKQIRTETDANSGQVITTQNGIMQTLQESGIINSEGKDASVNWQFADDAAIGSKTKVSAQTGQTFTSWWLNNQRISMYGNSSSPIWEVPITSDWEWPVDMTENGEWTVTGFGNTVQVFMGSSSTVFWEVSLSGNIMGVKLNQDGTIVYIADNNHDGMGNAAVSKYNVGQSTPIWEVPFAGDGTVFTGSKDGSKLVFCQYSGYNKMWVIDGVNGDILFDAFYANQNPPGLSNDGKSNR